MEEIDMIKSLSTVLRCATLAGTLALGGAAMADDATSGSDATADTGQATQGNGSAYFPETEIDLQALLDALLGNNE